MALTPANLEEAGRLLYGDNWKPALARDLRVSAEEVAGWLTRCTQMPQNLEVRLINLITQQRARLIAIATKIAE